MAVTLFFAGVAAADYDSRAGKALLTFLVDDLDEHLAALAERGLSVAPIETVPGVVRRAVITDPEGNTITFGQDLSS